MQHGVDQGISPTNQSTLADPPTVPLAAEVLSAAFRTRTTSSSFAARRRGQRRIMVGLLVLSDLFYLVLALRLAQWSFIAVRSWLAPDALLARSAPSLSTTLPVWLAVAFSTLVARGLYRFRYRDGIYSVTRVVTSIGLAGMFFAVLIFFLRFPTPQVFVVLVVVYSAVLLGIGRVGFRVMAAYLPPLNRRVLVVGSGPVAESTARMVAQYRRQGLYLVCPQLDLHGHPATQTAHEVCPLDENSLQRIAAYIHALDVDDVVITRNWYVQHCADVEHIFTMLNRLPARVHVAPDPAELMTRMSVTDFSGFPVLSLGLLALPRWQMVVKRLFDMAASALLIALLSPLLLVIALGIVLTSPGPAIFKQTRVGQYHRLFTIYKFRTMFAADAPIPMSDRINKRPGGSTHHSLRALAASHESG